MAVPLLFSLATVGALRLRRGRAGAGVVAWVLAALSGVVVVPALLSIGVFFVPVAACLLLGCALHRGPAG